MLKKAGVEVAICTDHPEVPIKYLPLSAAIAVRYGMDHDDAIRAITSVPAKILVIGVFLKLLHDGLVRYVADVLQDDESGHETDRLVRRTHFVVKQFRKLGLELVPVNLVRENVEGVLVVQLLLKGTEKACLCVGFWRSVHGKNCKVFSHILENLAIFSQGRNQFFPIVMRAGRDFKGLLYNNGLGNDIITVESSIQLKSKLKKVMYMVTK